MEEWKDPSLLVAGELINKKVEAVMWDCRHRALQKALQSRL